MVGNKQQPAYSIVKEGEDFLVSARVYGPGNSLTRWEARIPSGSVDLAYEILDQIGEARVNHRTIIKKNTSLEVNDNIHLGGNVHLGSHVYVSGNASIGGVGAQISSCSSYEGKVEIKMQNNQEGRLEIMVNFEDKQ